MTGGFPDQYWVMLTAPVNPRIRTKPYQEPGSYWAQMELGDAWSFLSSATHAWAGPPDLLRLEISALDIAPQALPRATGQARWLLVPVLVRGSHL
jgi:hypothetical protein